MSDLFEPAESQTGLATIETTNFALVFVPGGAEKIVASIKDEARRQAALLDATKPKDRAKLVSLGYIIARSKTTMDEAGKKLNEEANQKINAINADRRMVREEMDDLKAEILAPVELYKKAQAERETANNNAIAAMEALLDGIADLSIADIRQRAENIPAFDWAPEFQIKAAKVRASVVAQLTVAFQEAVAREEAAEAERVRLAEEAEAARLAEIEDTRLREEQIARDAAAEATRLAEAEAERKAEEARQAAQTLLKAEQEAAAKELARVEVERLAGIERERVAQEKAEIARVQNHKDALTRIRLTAVKTDDLSIREIDDRLESVEVLHQRDWEEFAEEAQSTADATCEFLTSKRADVAAQIEARRIASHENALADFASIVGSVAGQPSSAEVTQAIGSLQRLHANRDWQEFSERADKERADTMATFQAALQLAQAREQKVADALAETSRQQIVKDEQDRAAREIEAKRVRDEARAKDVAHQRKINREAMEDIMNKIEWPGGVAEALARMIVTALAKGEIRHCRVEY